MPGRLTTTIVASRAIAAGLAPRRQLDHAVGPDQEEEVVARPFLPHRPPVYRRYNEALAACASISDASNAECPAMAIRTISSRWASRRPIPSLVRRFPRDHEPDPIQPARLAALLGQDQVPEMDRVKGAAK